MNVQKLQRVVVDALEDVKAQDIKVFDTTGVTSLFDRVVVASGTSNRQTRALADRVRERVKEAGGDVLSVEGEDTGEWVLVDLADIVVHVMQPAIRQYYNLEEIWGEKPVQSKPARPRAASLTIVPSGGDAEPAAAPAPRRRTAAKKAAASAEPGGAAGAGTAPKKPAVRRTAAKKAAEPADAAEADAGAAQAATGTDAVVPARRAAPRARAGARRTAS